MFSNKNQWLLLLLIVVGVAAYRILFTETLPAGDQAMVRATEMEQIWHRIDLYPGTSLHGATAAQEVTETAVIMAYKWPTEADWPTVRAHFEQALPEAAWYKLGETTSEAGAPMLLFRQPPFHMILSLQDGLLDLRATWSADGSPLAP